MTSPANRRRSPRSTSSSRPGTRSCRPSDNPIAVADSIGYNRQIAQAASDQSNATIAQSWLGIGNQTANQVVNTLQSVNTTVLQALSTGSNNTQTYNEMAQQVQGLMSQTGRSRQYPVRQHAHLRGHRRRQPALLLHGYLQRELPAVHDKRRQRRPGRGLGARRPDVRWRDIGHPERLHDTAEHRHPPPGRSRPGLLCGAPGRSERPRHEHDPGREGGDDARYLDTSGDAASTAAQNTSTQLQTVLSKTVSTDVPTVTAALQSDLTTYQAALYAVSQTVPETLAQFLK